MWEWGGGGIEDGGMEMAVEMGRAGRFFLVLGGGFMYLDQGA